MEWTQGLLALNLAAMLFLGFTVINDDSVKVNTQMVNVSTERPIHNVTCPEPEILEPNITVNVTDEYEHVQNPELDTRTGMTGSSFEIHGIDSYGELYGSSMAPSIMDGDTVVNEEFTGQELEEGMIVRFNSDCCGPVVHRVVGDYQGRGWVKVSGDTESSVQSVNTSRVTHVVKAVVYN